MKKIKFIMNVSVALAILSLWAIFDMDKAKVEILLSGIVAGIYIGMQVGRRINNES